MEVGLVLTRKPGERVALELPDDGGVIWVTVCETQRKGSGVSLGFDAPAEVGIWREEIAIDRGIV